MACPGGSLLSDTEELITRLIQLRPTGNGPGAAVQWCRCCHVVSWRATQGGSRAGRAADIAQRRGRHVVPAFAGEDPAIARHSKQAMCSRKMPVLVLARQSGGQDGDRKIAGVVSRGCIGQARPLAAGDKAPVAVLPVW